MKYKNILAALLVGLAGAVAQVFSLVAHAATEVASEPIFTSRSVQPLNMLVMGRDHKLYYEAYNDASDLDGDGVLDIRFKPSITYYGYFSSDFCYNYSNNIFVPVSRTLDPLLRCVEAGGGEWSGNYLNYISTSRVDALRKVLYGGFRSVDLASGSGPQTVLERSYIPQDGHSWGKEYKSQAVDGYLISDYTPLAQPVSNARHLIANVSLSTDAATPLIRVLTNSQRRIWEWVSKEAPVAGSDCIGGSCEVAASVDGSHPANGSEFTSLVERFRDQPLAGTPVARSRINKWEDGALTLPGSGAASAGQADNYISVLVGKLVVTSPGLYTFAVNGDDAIDVAITGVGAFGWYGGHGAVNKTDSKNNIWDNWSNKSPQVNLAAGEYDITFRHEEGAGADSYQLAWTGPGIDWQVVPASLNNSAGLKNLQLTVYTRIQPAAVMANYKARVQVCKPELLDGNCKRYTREVAGQQVDSYKPEGILQEYGFAKSPNSPQMRFGLISGSYKNNTEGGVLRRAMANISDEINPDTGQFTAVNGVIGTINRFKITGFNNGYSGSPSDCGLLARAITNGECRMWGNPTAEMMYEAVRYFAGKTAPTPAFTYSSSTDDDGLGLPTPPSSWTDPYTQAGVESCAVPVQTVISDINPSYDTNSLPGSNWGGFGAGDIAGLNVGARADTIWQHEIGGSKIVFVGESNGQVTAGPSAKTATTFKTLRGLAPEEPTKQGGYYAASVANFGLATDLNSASGPQKLTTYAIALASPLPEFRIPVGGNVVRLFPFAKSVAYGNDSAWNTYSPTNTIVDFYVESVAPDGRSGVFRVNFEDVEQGNDHDMDAIARYAYEVLPDNTLRISMSSDYASGGVVQHMGYIISGTTKDGTYLEVRDTDTAEANDFAHPLDTVPGKWAGEPRGTGKLALQAVRTFQPSNTPAASFLKDPLWYAAKWGGFKDKNANGRPDIREEWTTATGADPNPDNYFLVTNALKLSDQLNDAFSEIMETLSSSSAAAASTGQYVQGQTQVIQARFRSSNWSGELVSYEILSNGDIGNIIWNSADRLPSANTRKVLTLDTSDGLGGVDFEWASLSSEQKAALQLGGVDADVAEKRLNYLRGSSAYEQRNGGDLRDRVNGALGDIVNSDPVYVDNLESRLPVVPAALSSSYNIYRAGLSSRQEMVYVGTNGGLLHGVCARNCGADLPGEELLAYVPNSLFAKLYKLTQPSYTHEFYVDGPVTVSDANIDGAWKTVLLGTLGAGGKAVYALDVSHPGSFGTANVLWEFTPEKEAADLATDASQTDLGLTVGRAHIARVRAGDKPVAVFSSGFNGASGYASLMVVDLQSGTLLKRIRVQGAAQSLASPALLDEDADGYLDYVYAGDDTGKLWRFDFTGNSVNDWGLSFGGEPLLAAQQDQPITSAPEIYKTEDAQVMIYVGTGRYLGTSDKNSTALQSMYAVRDKWLGDQESSFEDPVKTENLVQQSIAYEVESAILPGGATAAYPIRVTSALDVDYGSKHGWYIDLIPPSPASAQGERVNTTPVVRHGRLIFTTLIPPVSSCEFGGTGWLMEMDAISGKRFDESVLDINGDAHMDNNDKYDNGTDQLSIGGRKFPELIRPPAFVGFGEQEGKYISGSSGGLSKVWEKGGASLVRGRLSWQQLE